MENELIRLEVIDSQKSASLGSIVVSLPFTNAMLVAFCLVFLVFIVYFITSWEYVKRASVPGVVESASGVLKILPSQPGIITRLFVREGDHVKKGEILLQMSNEHNGGSGVNISQAINDKTTLKLVAMKQEMVETLRLNDEDLQSSKESLGVLKNTRTALINQIEHQRNRVEESQKNLSNYERLKSSGFMSALQVSQQTADVLDQQTRLDISQKDLIAVDGDIKKIYREISNIPRKKIIARAQLSRNIATLQNEISQLDSDQSWSILAPMDGVITTVSVSSGQSIASSSNLISILPNNAELRVRLYAPSKSLGFIKDNQEVKMKVDAFPYQKFGWLEGKVKFISESPTAVSEINPSQIAFAKDGQSQEPLFSILVIPENNYMFAYGKKEYLKPGMQLQAEVSLDRRKLYEWIFEPIIAMKK